MSKYEINWLEHKTTTAGKDKINATLIDEENIQTKDVTIWPDFPGYSDLRPGTKVEGTIDEKVIKGRKWASLHAATNANGTFKPRPKSDITKAVEKKNEGIAIAQDKKAEGIKDASTFRSATDMTIQWRQERLAAGINTTTEEWQSEWIRVRKWFDAKFSEPFN